MTAAPPAADHYRCTLYGDLGCQLDGIDDRGTVYPVRSPGQMSVSQCRAYAAESGFTFETTGVTGSRTVIYWAAP